MQKSAASRVVSVLVFLVMTMYSIWSWLFQVGLYALLVRLQFSTFEQTYPIATGIVMWVVLAVIPLSSLYANKRRHEFELTPQELTSRLRLRSVSLLLWCVVTTLLAFGLYSFSSAIPSEEDPPIVIEPGASQTDSAWQFTSMWFQKVTISGEALTESVALREEALIEGTTVFRRYTPIRTLSNSSRPIQFVDSFSSDSVRQINQAPVALTGYVLPKALPVLVRQSFEQDGLSTAKYLYLLSNDVVDGRTLLRIVSAILAIIGLFLLFALLHSPFHNRQKLAAQCEHQGNDQHKW